MEIRLTNITKSFGSKQVIAPTTLTVEQIQALFQEVLEEAGALEGLDDSRVQGSTEGEPHGIAELYYDFAHDTVRFRVAFDLELQLIGVDAPRVL